MRTLAIITSILATILFSYTSYLFSYDPISKSSKEGILVLNFIIWYAIPTALWLTHAFIKKTPKIKKRVLPKSEHLIHITILKKLAIAEGISYIALGITIPIKYLIQWPLPNYIVGMSHGLLFMAYCLWVLIVGVCFYKKVEFYAIGLLMSLIPFGTFWFERKYLNENNFTDPNLLD
jgi:integral membrane protein